ncbi:hypothetical protein KUV62_04650 [Salipiger bermudensis]|uniref:hypothetical protein n=1 Tax=Salipiger bermudensis TaxID=344736 RepID=UPI001C996269|nr:hypothetical protein [Salipiger bermudensis]MBY6003185.1 hypothetical protein [Salipiger bermudensis]
MDLVSLVYYAIICGLLCWAGPRIGGPVLRVLAGVLVGVLAAAVLPALKAGLGF